MRVAATLLRTLLAKALPGLEQDRAIVEVDATAGVVRLIELKA